MCEGRVVRVSEGVQRLEHIVVEAPSVDDLLVAQRARVTRGLAHSDQCLISTHASRAPHTAAGGGAQRQAQPLIGQSGVDAISDYYYY